MLYIIYNKNNYYKYKDYIYILNIIIYSQANIGL